MTLADKAKTSLNIPVLCTSEFNREQQSNSKLLRANQVGAMLKNGLPFAKNYEMLTEEWYIPPPYKHFEFSQPVNGVLFFWLFEWENPDVKWSDSSYSWYYMTMPFREYVYLPFRGTDMYFLLVGGMASGVRIYLWGLY